MLGQNNKDQMHPDDVRNLIIFFVLAAFLYFSYDHYILSPQREALEAAKVEQAQHAAAGETVVPEAAASAVEKAVPREDILARGERLSFDNGEVFGTIALRGGRLDDLSFHKYYETLEKKESVVLLAPKQTEHPRYVEYGWVAAEKGVKLPDTKTLWRVRGNTKLTKESPVTLVWDNGEGLVFERTIALDEHYMFAVTQKVTNRSGKKVTLYPYGLITQTGLPAGLQGRWIMHEGPIGFIGGKLFEKTYKEMRKEGGEDVDAQTGWIGITDKYWLTALVPGQDQDGQYNFRYTGSRDDPDNQGRYQVDYRGAPLALESGQDAQAQTHVFAGAKQVLLLEEYQKALNIPQFDLAVDFGMFWFMTKPFFYLLHFLGKLTGNMGVAIILLTILIRGGVFPLTNTSYRSFAKMKKVSPQILELRNQYGDDKQKLQQELVKVYEKEGVNPMAGCLPIVAQIPIFFALYKTLFVTIEIRHAPFFGWIQDLSAPDPTSVFNLFGLISWDPPSFLMIGVWPCIMLVAMIIQKKLNPPPQDQLQRDMANYFPFMIAFILSGFASGLVIYWAFSAVIGVIQQMIIMRSLGVPIHLFGETKEDKAMEEAVEKGPAVHPLIEMVEDDAEEALFGDGDEADDSEGGSSKEIKKPKPKKSKKKK
ncbi:MAG: membrane protein insertase YidC [Alphaproteobacteria bacterium]|nr:membrane protein insertase YidC [Alphaproteobacteria bacterium]